MGQIIGKRTRLISFQKVEELFLEIPVDHTNNWMPVSSFKAEVFNKILLLDGVPYKVDGTTNPSKVYFQIATARVLAVKRLSDGVHGWIGEGIWGQPTVDGTKFHGVSHTEGSLPSTTVKVEMGKSITKPFIPHATGTHAGKHVIIVESGSKQVVLEPTLPTATHSISSTDFDTASGGVYGNVIYLSNWIGSSKPTHDAQVVSSVNIFLDKHVTPNIHDSDILYIQNYKGATPAGGVGYQVTIPHTNGNQWFDMPPGFYYIDSTGVYNVRGDGTKVKVIYQDS